MRPSPATLRRAMAHLRERDPVLGAVIDRVGPCRFRARAEGTHFDAICRSIVYQQLSGRAAATILGRVLALFGDHAPTPAELASTPDGALRAAGLSRQKLSYLKDLASHVTDATLPIETLHELSDGEVIDALVQVKGIGRWTAQMFLIFRLGRPDVLPELDLGVRKAVRVSYRMRRLPSPQRLTTLGAKWAPYRSVASWYLWRSLDLQNGALPT